MITQSIVWWNCPCHPCRVMRLDPCIYMLAIITIAPAIKSTVFNRGEIIWNQIIAELITLIDYPPEFAALGLPVHTTRITKSDRKRSCLSISQVKFHDQCAAFFLIQAIFSHVTVGTYRNIKFAARRIGNDIFGPVMV